MTTMLQDSSHNSRTKSNDFNRTTSEYIPESNLALLEKLKQNTGEISDRGCCLYFNNSCCKILAKWWNVHYKLQHRIIHIVEQTLFHALIILLIIIDCLLVIGELVLDYIKIGKYCQLNSENEGALHKIELAIEIFHYTSLGILSFFLLELAVKIYAFGRHWWNPHHKKMEWLDAIIVIVSFTIDLVTLFVNSYYAELALLFITLRLWRFVSYLIV